MLQCYVQTVFSQMVRRRRREHQGLSRELRRLCRARGPKSGKNRLIEGEWRRGLETGLGAKSRRHHRLSRKTRKRRLNVEARRRRKNGKAGRKARACQESGRGTNGETRRMIPKNRRVGRSSRETVSLRSSKLRTNKE
jgi:hypothetical protein